MNQEEAHMEEIKAYYALTKKAFDILAPFYNVMTLPLVKVREQVVDFTNAGKGSTILDVATGTGQQAFAFAKRGYDVIGVDLTESMLAIARKNNKDGLVKFETADATHLRFEENSFGVSCVSFALHDMPLTIREKVLREMVRVTQPNGIIVIVDYDLPRNQIGRALIYRLITLYEGEYYRQFIASDLEALIGKTGIEIRGKLSVLLGAARIWKGTKNRIEKFPARSSQVR
jgi:demethylmenaquinone methyltransferase/2-methoxy-6-polyprenyl-1,4-benzoquinol methylase